MPRSERTEEVAYGVWPPGAQVRVEWNASGSRIILSIEGAELEVLLDPDAGKRLFRDVHEGMGDP